MHTIFHDELAAQRMADLRRQAAEQRLLRELRASRKPTVRRRRVWERLADAIKTGMDPRRYELVTLASARALRSTYCAMAHGRVLRDRFYDQETVRRIATDHTRAGLTPAEVAVIDFADQVARDATSIGPDDIERLRAHGLCDTEILDVALAAAAQCFFGTVLDAMGAQADGALSQDLEPPLRAALTVGRAPEPADRPTPLSPEGVS